MKKGFAILLILILFSACAQKGPEVGAPQDMTWQQYYELGTRYLSEGNYEEAIIAFTAAIEIDPKQAAAYIGRGDAYIGLADSEDQADNEDAISSAKSDYETAISLNPSVPEVYQKLADIYLRLGDMEAARSIIEEGYAKTGDTGLKEYLESLKGSGEPPQLDLNAYGGTEFTSRTNYREFDSFSAAEQDYLRNMLAAAVSQNTDAMQEMLGFQFEPVEHYDYWNGYTQVDGYKIKTYTAGAQVLDSGQPVASAWIEIRPENGTGFYYSITHIGPHASAGSDQESEAFMYTKIVCTCTDWQWNGEYEETYSNHHISTWDNGSTTVIDELCTTSGKMENSLRVGTFMSESHKTEVWSKWTDLNEESTETFTSVYENGVPVEVRGRTIEGAGPARMDGTHGGAIEDQWVLDDLYW